jgi:hypothetical protein
VLALRRDFAATRTEKTCANRASPGFIGPYVMTACANAGRKGGRAIDASGDLRKHLTFAQ